MRQFSGQTLLPSNRWRTRWTSQSCAKRSVEGETFSQGRDAVRNVKCAFGAWQFKERDSSLQYCRAANVLWSKKKGGKVKDYGKTLNDKTVHKKNFARTTRTDKKKPCGRNGSAGPHFFSASWFFEPPRHFLPPAKAYFYKTLKNASLSALTRKKVGASVKALFCFKLFRLVLVEEELFLFQKRCYPDEIS